MKKYTWSTHKIVQETKDAITIFFKTGSQLFSYLPGQYLNLTCTIGGEQVSRSYSFSSIPSDGFPSITVKRIADGKMSNYLLENAALTDTWDVEAPFGNFTFDGKLAPDSRIVFLAGGSGISPLFSMLKSIGQDTNPPLLLYSNKSPEEAIFWNGLETMRSENRLNIYHSFTSPSHISTQLDHISGRFTPLVLRSILFSRIENLEKAHFYICGPTELMTLYHDVLLGINIAERQIHMEYFDPIVVEIPHIGNDGITREILLSYFTDQYVNDELQSYECTSLIEVDAGVSLLDAIRDYGIPVPHSCKKGTCGSCWAIKTDGQVQMVNNHALTEQEISESMVLLCQSYPLDHNVSITIHDNYTQAGKE